MSQTSAISTHAAAVLAHAAEIGLISKADDTARLADAHPALAGFADIVAADHGGLADNVNERDQVMGHHLGDAYQELSVEARKGRALCQTPYWVTWLLLDISLDHAYEEWGPHIRMIDPACGTGHILVETLLRAHTRQRRGLCRSSHDGSPRLPVGTSPLERIHAALNTVHGVDLDPYAVLVARYRLLALCVALLRGSRHDPTPEEIAALPLHVAHADSLLATDEPLLERGSYHVVVANPPYITVKDAKANAAIRERYREVCNGKYSLALPFHALMNELLTAGGWCAQLTANSFMKREFGAKYIEGYLTKYDLTWVIDTSGAYIPGHGTPTAILVNRNQPPASDTVPTVMGKRGEPSKPADPARGVVWTEIARAVQERESMARLRTATAEPEAPVAPVPTPVTPVEPMAAEYVQPTLFDLVGV